MLMSLFCLISCLRDICIYTLNFQNYTNLQFHEINFRLRTIRKITIKLFFSFEYLTKIKTKRNNVFALVMLMIYVRKRMNPKLQRSINNSDRYGKYCYVISKFTWNRAVSWISMYVNTRLHISTNSADLVHLVFTFSDSFIDRADTSTTNN